MPCYCRQQVTSSIYRWKEEAFQEEGKQRNPVLITNEDLSYEIYITNEPNRSKIHGPGWEKLISDYDLCYRDLIIINLDTGSLSIEIDLRLNDSRGGHTPLPKPSLGKCTNLHPVLSTTFISILGAPTTVHQMNVILTVEVIFKTFHASLLIIIPT